MDLEEGIFSMDSPKNEPSFSVDIEVLKDDITKREVDVIVNTAHEHLTGGGGVDGAIHDAAGEKYDDLVVEDQKDNDELNTN